MACHRATVARTRCRLARCGPRTATRIKRETPARVDLLPTPPALRSGNWCRVVDVRAPLSRKRQCRHRPVIKQDNRAKEIRMVDVPPDRRIFIRLDLDYYRTRAHPVRRELLAAAGLEERPLPCSGGAPTDSERRTHQPVLLCPHRSWPWWPHLVNRLYSAPVKAARSDKWRRQPQASRGQNLMLGTRQLRLESD